MDRGKTTHLSKFLSLVLRHEPNAAGIELDGNGWVAIDTSSSPDAPRTAPPRASGASGATEEVRAMTHDRNALTRVAQAAVNYIQAGVSEHSAVMWGLLLDEVAGLGYVDAAGEQVAEAVADAAARMNDEWVMTGQ